MDNTNAMNNTGFLREAARASLARGYDPLKGRTETHPDGASWFDIPDGSDLVGFLGSVEIDGSEPDGWSLEASVSTETVKVFTAEMTRDIWGWLAKTDLDSVGEIRIGTGPHGNLEPQAEDLCVMEVMAKWTTAVAVLEDGKWLLAAIYPGGYEPLPDLSGLKEGDVIDAAEAGRRGILRVKAIAGKEAAR